MQKINKLGKITIGAAAGIIVLAAGLGFGLGFGLSGNNKINDSLIGQIVINLDKSATLAADITLPTGNPAPYDGGASLDFVNGTTTTANVPIYVFPSSQDDNAMEATLGLGYYGSELDVDLGALSGNTVTYNQGSDEGGNTIPIKVLDINGKDTDVTDNMNLTSSISTLFTSFKVESDGNTAEEQGLFLSINTLNGPNGATYNHLLISDEVDSTFNLYEDLFLVNVTLPS